jgi:hypothetical protein
MQSDFFEPNPLEGQPAPLLITGDDVVTRGNAAAWATFSTCGKYRYLLGRRWDDHGALLVVCMLNPSTATEKQLDPTLRRVHGFAMRDKFGGFVVVNCFAFRATYKIDLRAARDPVGPRNDEAILAAVNGPMLGKFVIGWGKPDNRKIERRMNQVLALPLRRKPFTFGEKTKHGHPRHPLYVKGTQPFLEW